MEMKHVRSRKTALTITLTTVKINTNSHGNTPLSPEFTTVSTFLLMCSSSGTDREKRAFPHAKAQLAGLGVITQLTRFVFSGASIRRKRHESVLSTVMDRPVSVFLTERYDVPYNCQE